jgi:hypothetical protein
LPNCLHLKQQMSFRSSWVKNRDSKPSDKHKNVIF